MPNAIVVALGAGFASALLVVSGAAGWFRLLILLAPFPLAIAGLGWGWRAAAIGSATAAALLALLGSIGLGLGHLIVCGAPVAIACYYLLLNREYADDQGRRMIEWYPVGWVVFGLALGAGAVGAAGLYVSAPSLEKLQELADRTVAQLVESGVALPGGNEQIDEEARGKLATFFTMFWSSALASAWFWIILLNLYFGARVAHASGLLARPWPNLSMIAMPRYAGLLLAVTFALAFWNILPLYERLLVSAFATTLLLAFLLVGLAIVHNVTWGQPLRPFILVAVYAFLLFFNPISGFAIATLALAEPLWRLRHPGKGHQDPTQPPQ